MVGLGTIINVIAIIAGGILGLLFGRFIKDRYQETLMKVTGVATLFIGIGGVLEEMLTVSDGQISSGGTMMMIGSLAIGALIGEFLDLDRRIEQFGQWLKVKTGNSGDQSFVNAFVTASLTVCIGAMAIVGAIQDGIFGDYSTLAAKAVLDLIIIMVMTASLGKGCMFSAIPVAMLQGGVTILARWIEPLMTTAALSNLSFVGAVLIFCVGLNLIWKNTIRVANLLPSVVIAVVFAFLPVSL
jgi:uncharacterized membrane protein YqgA involved in biofilm formation